MPLVSLDLRAIREMVALANPVFAITSAVALINASRTALPVLASTGRGFGTGGAVVVGCAVRYAWRKPRSTRPRLEFVVVINERNIDPSTMLAPRATPAHSIGELFLLSPAS